VGRLLTELAVALQGPTPAGPPARQLIDGSRRGTRHAQPQAWAV